MYFEPIKGMTVTKMCIWVDEHMHDVNCDDELLFKYLYFICVGVFCKSQCFQTRELFEEFCFYDAEKVWERIRNKKLPQFKGSVLNYIRSTFVAHKAMFLNETLYDDRQLISIEELQSQGVELYKPTNTLAKKEFQMTIDNISRIVKRHLKYRVRYKHLWNDIYISCLASLISAITPHTVRAQAYNRLLVSNRTESIDGLAQLYYREENEIVLYHLDESYRDYIQILVKELKHQIAKELAQTLDDAVDCFDSAQLITEQMNE